MPRDLKVRVTAAQTNLLCTFFEENPEVIRGYKKTPKCVETVQNKWIKITGQLNSLGPPRNHKAWAKYLCDLKAKLKKKRIKWKQNSDGTGPIICNADDINEIRLRMLQVLRKEALCAQDLHEVNISDQEDSARDDHDDDDKYEMIMHPLDESKCKTEEIKATSTGVQQAQVLLNGNNYCTDEFDTFGRMIAQQLRMLPLAIALETEEMLLSILRKQRLKITDGGGSTSTDPLNQ